MSTRPRRLVLTASLALLVAACESPQNSPPSAAPASPVGTPSAPPREEPASASPSAPAAGQTDTEWGRIWDTLPDGFPRFPGATPADDATGEPASARFAVEGGDPLAIAQWMQDALETATFSTEALNGPAEDGGYIIDSAGDGRCRIQTRIAPFGSMTLVTVLYGSDCPRPQQQGRCMLAPSAGTPILERGNTQCSPRGLAISAHSSSLSACCSSSSSSA
jgi:hypothetical protein